MKIMNKVFRFSTVLYLLLTTITWAQKGNDRMSHQRISALKMNFIAEKMQCNTEEEAKFWTAYQKYETALHQEYYQKIKSVRRKYREKLENIQETTAAEVLKELAALRSKKETIRRQLESELKLFLTAKQRLQLYAAEDSFHRNMIKKRKHHGASDKVKQE